MSRAPAGPPAAVLFDLDDTLLDNDRVRASLVHTCAWVAAQIGGITGEDVRRANVDVWRVYWPQIEQPTWLGQVEGYAVNREAWRRTLAACGSTDPDLVERAFERHWVVSGEASAFYDDVHELLDHLRACGIRTGLVTNGASDVQRDKIRLLCLDDHMDVVVVSGEHGVAKPDAAVFELALRALGVAAADTWHVGDNLLTDVAGARNAGITAVWLDRAGAARVEGASTADLRVTSLRALLELLRRD